MTPEQGLEPNYIHLLCIYNYESVFKITYVFINNTWNSEQSRLDIVVKSHTLYRLSYPGYVNTRTKRSNLLFSFISRITFKYGKIFFLIHILIIKTFKKTYLQHLFFCKLMRVPRLQKSGISIESTLRHVIHFYT